MTAPGPRNLITDVDGIRVGNAEDARLRSGVTVVLCDDACAAAADVRGGAPGTRETDALDATCLVPGVDAIVLSGGSAFGLAACDGVAAWLRAAGRGFPIGPVRVPVVPGAIIFDLLNGGDKAWGDASPYPALARRACEAAAAGFAIGNAGAGLGAKAGFLKGGLGSASLVTGDGLQVGAVMVANPHGSPVIPGTRTLWAWAFERDGELGGQVPASPRPDAWDWRPRAAPGSGPRPGENTSIGVVAVNATLDRAAARRVAIMAQDGIARAVWPAHTPFDGDTLFVLATGRRSMAGGAADLSRLGAMAADCVARAMARAVHAADTLGDRPGYRAWCASGASAP